MYFRYSDFEKYDRNLSKKFFYLYLKEDNVSILFISIMNKRNEINISLIDFDYCIQYADNNNKIETVNRKDDNIMICYILLNLSLFFLSFFLLKANEIFLIECGINLRFSLILI